MRSLRAESFFGGGIRIHRRTQSSIAGEIQQRMNTAACNVKDSRKLALERKRSHAELRVSLEMIGIC